MVSEGSRVSAEWGPLPQHWKVVSADSLCSKITKGTTPPKADISTSGWIPFLRVNNLSSSDLSIDSGDMIFVSEVSHRGFLSRSVAYPGDVVMNIVGPPLGKMALLPNKFPEYNLNQAIVIYRTRPTCVDPNFFLAYLGSDVAQQWLMSRSKKTSGQQNLTIELCKQLPVPLPPIDEQSKIADILSGWDRAIGLVDKLIGNSRAQRSALMRELLTARARLPRFVTTTRHHVELQHIAEVQVSNVDKKSDPDQCGVRLCNYTDVYYNRRITSQLDFMESTATKNQIDKFSLRKGDVLITKDSETPDDIAISSVVDEDLPGVLCGYHLALLRPVANLVDGYFLSSLLSLNEVRHYFFTRANGATRFGLAIDDIREAQLVIPSLEEQQEIARTLRKSERTIRIYEDQLLRLKQEKKALKQQLLSGRRRVTPRRTHDACAH
jgi:type I restriction enzyme S subunit